MLPATCPPRCLGGAVRIFYKTQQRGSWPPRRGPGRGARGGGVVVVAGTREQGHIFSVSKVLTQLEDSSL